MFVFKKSKNKEEETINLTDLYKKNKAYYNTPEAKESIRQLTETFDEFQRENDELADRFRKEYEQGQIDWETYNIKRKFAMKDPLNVDEQTDAFLRKMGTDYKQGIIDRDSLQKELEKYDVEFEEYGLNELSPDEFSQILKLNGTLRAEAIIVSDFAKKKDWDLYDIADYKAVVSYLIENFNEWDTNGYGFIKNNLTSLLRQINIAEISKENNTSLPNTSGVVLSIEGIATGEDFEAFCAELLKNRGYNEVSLTPGSGDHGVDVLAEKDDVTYAIQCKYYSTPVGNSAIQEAFSGKKIYHRDVAVVMTNSTFTAQAVDDAKELGVKLWDGTKIEDWVNKLKQL